jgi:hypothetical protein
VAHESQMRFFTDVVAAFPAHFAGRVLDVGSLDINGGPHELFSSAEYVGVDLAPGPNVTDVARGEKLEFPDGHFDVAMSSECFEHNPQWPATLRNMVRMTRASGLVAFSAASTGRREHGTSRSDGGFAAPLAVAVGQEWYCNLTVSAVESVVAGSGLQGQVCLVNRETSDLLFLAVTSPATSRDLDSVAAIGLRWADLTSRTTYSGSPIRRLLLTISGDRGANLASSARAWLRGS